MRHINILRLINKTLGSVKNLCISIHTKEFTIVHRDHSTEHRKAKLTPLGETDVIYQMAYIMENVNCKEPFSSTSTCWDGLQHPPTEEAHKENECVD